MSDEWGAIIDALEEHLRTVMPSLPAGERGFERDLRPVSEIPDAAFPHAFAHDPSELIAELSHGQSATTFSIQLSIWTRGTTQPELAKKLDLFRDQVKADPTLGGLVDHALVAQRSVRDLPNRQERGGILIVNARWTV